MDFEDYVDVRGQSLLRLAYVLCGDRHLAEDLVQSALAKAFRHWSRVARAEQPDAYVQKIVINTFLSARRRRWTGEVPTSTRGLGEPTTAAASPDVAEAALAHTQFMDMLQGLQPRAKAVLVLRYYADQDDVTIATQLGMSRGSVRSTAARALALLRDAAGAPSDDRNLMGRSRRT